MLIKSVPGGRIPCRLRVNSSFRDKETKGPNIQCINLLRSSAELHQDQSDSVKSQKDPAGSHDTLGTGESYYYLDPCRHI